MALRPEPEASDWRQRCSDAYAAVMARHTRSVHLPGWLYERVSKQATRLQRPIAWVLRQAWLVAERAISERAPPPRLHDACNDDRDPDPRYPKK